jgi:hypothetical protein
MTPRLKLWRACFGRSLSLLLACFAIITGPIACQLFCSADCCAQDSQCPVCLFARLSATQADGPLHVVIPVSLVVFPSSAPHFEPCAAKDYLLLPSCGPPCLS